MPRKRPICNIYNIMVWGTGTCRFLPLILVHTGPAMIEGIFRQEDSVCKYLPDYEYQIKLSERGRSGSTHSTKAAVGNLKHRCKPDRCTIVELYMWRHRPMGKIRFGGGFLERTRRLGWFVIRCAKENTETALGPHLGAASSPTCRVF
jgi:hypothetical protein